jgi:sodium/potassium-transporting ATPase subunit alpha
LDATMLVPGDVVEIRNGEKVPADVVLITSNEMKVNNSSLTGESEELIRNPESKSENIFESKNVCFFGTLCTAGTGTGIVIKTGDETVIGQIATLA